ncbi:helix-turn-helix transcriptional regulator [Prauserella flavalba]|uniref:HTH luxR-type domain-containing protein n=1 Tax=Prauserella flavalba TaxID=1477506 RepID=A0A318LGR7_9PSEU|nr:helix-turn-helix transcriptional regulator [Prauserella flavalba]PXY23942.1 hypothetical protein BA062_27095 [Prauserella flavalba]
MIATQPTRVAVLHRNTLPLSTRARVEATLASAKREVLVVSGLADSVHGRLPLLGKGSPRPGVRYRVLVPDEARTIPAMAMRLGSLALAGADVRTVADAPADAVVIDGELAVLPGEPSDLALFRLPSVVSTIVALFERVWPSAVPFVPGGLPDEAELTERERAMLTLLSAGYTDEAAAASLGVSVRTVRRLVSGLMSRLGARSRFQAGAKAADRGWLVEPAC